MMAYFIKEVMHQNGSAGVVEIAVGEQKASSVFELAEGEVGAASGVSALLAVNAEADMGFLDHGDVVGAVSDRCRHRLVLAFLDQSHDLDPALLSEIIYDKSTLR